MRRSAVLALVALLCACSNRPEVITRTHGFAHRIDKVYVATNGSIALNGKHTDARSLARELAKLASESGTVWYARAGATAPTDAQMVAFRTIVDARIPVRLFADATFTKQAAP